MDSLEISLKNLDLNSFNSNIIVATLICLNKLKWIRIIILVLISIQLYLNKTLRLLTKYLLNKAG